MCVCLHGVYMVCVVRQVKGHVFFCGVQKRKNLLKEFQEGDCKVLVCTDIASRGIDTSKVWI